MKAIKGGGGGGTKTFSDGVWLGMKKLAIFLFLFNLQGVGQTAESVVKSTVIPEDPGLMHLHGSS